MPSDAIAIIDHSRLVERVRSGAVHSAHAVGELGGWHLIVKDGETECVLGTAKGFLRRFRRLEALVGYLKEIGLEHFEVDATLYSSRKASSMRSNSAPQAQNEAVDHEAWFREEVQRTLEGVDRGEIRLITDEQHRARWRQMRSDLVARSREE